MMNPQQSMHNEGAAGGSSSSSNPSMQNNQQQTKKKHHVISAASSVASTNSLTSSSTKPSSLSTSTGTTTLGGMAAGGSDAIKSLMQMQQQHAPPQNKDVPAETKTKAPVKSSTKAAKAVQVTDASSSSSSSSTSTSSSVTAPGRRDSSGSMVLPMAGGAPPHPVAEFLFQLTKMLTDNNTKYIEWRNASIFVHDPPVSTKPVLFVLILSMYLGSKVSLNTFSLLNSMTHDVHNIIQGMEKEILPKYFRHSNYSSFVSIMEVIYLTVSNLKCRYIFSFQSLYLTVNFSFTNVWISIKHQTYFFFFFFTATSNELLRLPENSWKRQDVSLLIRQ